MWVTPACVTRVSRGGKAVPAQGTSLVKTLQVVFGLGGFLIVFVFFFFFFLVLFKVTVELLPLKSKFIFPPSEGG